MLDEPRRPCTIRKKPDTRGHILYIPFVVSVQNRWIHRVIKQEGGCRGLGKRRMGNDSLMGNRVFFWKGERFGTRRGQWLHRIVNILNATELFTFKWLILCFVNSTLIF